MLNAKQFFIGDFLCNFQRSRGIVSIRFTGINKGGTNSQVKL